MKMKIPRLYTGDDGQSHWGEVEVELESRGGGLTAGLPIKAADGVSFLYFTPTAEFGDWHPAPSRRYVITLAGEVEYEVGDGTKRRFGPGGIFMANDLTGQGHRGRCVSNEPRVAIHIPLAE